MANSHTFELYTKISNGDFEKVSSENENSNHMMVLARLPVQGIFAKKKHSLNLILEIIFFPLSFKGGMMKLARLPSKRIPDKGIFLNDQTVIFFG